MSQRDEAYDQAKAENKVDWQRRLHWKSKDKKLLEPTLSNVMLIFENVEQWRGLFRQNLFTQEIELARPPPYEKGETGLVKDYDITRIRQMLQEGAGYDGKVSHLGETELIKALQAVAFDNGYHPIREYLDGLEWDGETRLDYLFQDWLGGLPVSRDADGNLPMHYVQRVSAIWMLQAVARIYKPGCKADYVLILEGPQRLGKSMFLDLLAGQWFMDTPFIIGDKDGYQAMQGKWIIELAELDSFNKAEATRAKAFFSSSSDRFRVPYGRNVEEFPRQCVFAGTTNMNEYLQDPTGNFRYMPIMCTSFQRDGPEGLEAQIDQIWAEAVHRFKAGEQWWPTAEDLELFGVQQDMREIPDYWELIIEKWIADEIGPIEDRTEQPRLRMTDIAKEALELEARSMQERATASRIGRCMHRLGWMKKQATSSTERQKHGRHYYTPKDWEEK